MLISFIKCHGSGNDFPLIDARALSIDAATWAAIARALADSRGPVGGDGLLALTNGDDGHAFGMKMWNADGSESETCLNGLRCVARLGFEALEIDRASVRLKTSSAYAERDADLAPGVTTIREVAGPVTLGLGVVRVIDQVIAALPGTRSFTALAIPNPHLVSFVETIDDAELTVIGELCEAAPDWLPERANVSFVEVRGENLYVRTHERGVGLTDSCGSAMAASTYAACLTGRAAFGREISVFNRGGLVKAQAEEDGMVRLSGNATFEWAGTIDVTEGVASGLEVTARFDDETAAWAWVIADIGGNTGL